MACVPDMCSYSPFFRCRCRRIKALRKLSKARKEVPVVGGFNSHKSRDIIGEYSNYSSTVYAPIRRDGQAIDKGGEKYDVLSKTGEREREGSSSLPSTPQRRRPILIAIHHFVLLISHSQPH